MSIILAPVLMVAFDLAFRVDTLAFGAVDLAFRADTLVFRAVE